MNAVAKAVRETLYEAHAERVLARSVEGELLPRVPTRAQIERLEAEMRRFPPLTIEPVHHFAAGLYAREITIPKGTLLTGKVHRCEHLNIVSKGEITVWTEDGMKRIRAPFTMRSRPGTKRVGYTHEETVWTTIHATEETDLARLEAELVEPELAYDGERLLAQEDAQCRG